MIIRSLYDEKTVSYQGNYGVSSASQLRVKHVLLTLLLSSTDGFKRYINKQYCKICSGKKQALSNFLKSLRDKMVAWI